jgi:hypothetical protein
MFVPKDRLRKAAEYREARRLRERDGMPMKQIATKLHVSPGTVHRWTRDIELTPEQRRRNWPGQPPWVLTEGRRRQARKKRAEYQQEGRRVARRGEALHQAGCMLYWAEGAKSRNQLDFANSDVHMVQFFLSFLRTCFRVKSGQVRIRLNVYTDNDLSIEEIEEHWLRALELPRSCLGHHTLDHRPTSSSGRRAKKLPYGVCTVRINNTRIVQHIFGAIQEYAGFEDHRWLDGPPRRSRPRGPRATRTRSSR